MVSLLGSEGDKFQSQHLLYMAGILSEFINIVNFYAYTVGNVAHTKKSLRVRERHYDQLCVEFIIPCFKVSQDPVLSDSGGHALKGRKPALGNNEFDAVAHPDIVVSRHLPAYKNALLFAEVIPVFILDELCNVCRNIILRTYTPDHYGADVSSEPEKPLPLDIGIGRPDVFKPPYS